MDYKIVYFYIFIFTEVYVILRFLQVHKHTFRYICDLLPWFSMWEYNYKDFLVFTEICFIFKINERSKIFTQYFLHIFLYFEETQKLEAAHPVLNLKYIWKKCKNIQGKQIIEINCILIRYWTFFFSNYNKAPEYNLKFLLQM